jgi:hypothetical protein
MTDLHRLAIGLSLEAAAERLLPHFLNHVDLTSD